MISKVTKISILVLLVLSLAACSAVSGLKTANDTANNFMQALHDQDNETSWNLLSSGVQDQIGTTDDWANFTAPRGFDSWKFNSSNLSGDQAQVDGTATLGKENYDVSLVMDANGDGWLISGITFTYKE